MRGLKDRVVLVTGGGGAIGSAVCRRLSEEGAKVCVADRNGAAAQAVADSIIAAGGRASSYTFDISDYSKVKAVVSDIESTIGPIDVLINNAGWDRFSNFLDMTPDSWDELIAINLRGPMNLCHAVLPGMVARGRGRVVNVSSDAARVGSSGESVYSACKGGIISFTKTVARELARKGVTLNVVCPGPTDTPLLRTFLGEGEGGKKVYAALERAIPMKRLGNPEDLPGAMCFLSSDDAAFITGQVLSVSGGLTMAG